MTEDQEPEHKHKHSLPPAYVLLVETAGVGGLGPTITSHRFTTRHGPSRRLSFSRRLIIGA